MKRKGSAYPGRHCSQQCREVDQNRSHRNADLWSLRLRLALRGRVDEDGAFGRVHHLCGDAPEPHPSDRPETSAAHGQ